MVEHRSGLINDGEAAGAVGVVVRPLSDRGRGVVTCGRGVAGIDPGRAIAVVAGLTEVGRNTVAKGGPGGCTLPVTDVIVGVVADGAVVPRVRVCAAGL